MNQEEKWLRKEQKEALKHYTLHMTYKFDLERDNVHRVRSRKSAKMHNDHRLFPLLFSTYIIKIQNYYANNVVIHMS